MHDTYLDKLCTIYWHCIFNYYTTMAITAVQIIYIVLKKCLKSKFSNDKKKNEFCRSQSNRYESFYVGTSTCMNIH